MNAENVNQLFSYVQERCLWQFFSRSWDRQENIDGIFSCATDILTDKPPARQTPMEKLFYADASVMVRDLKERFPWVAEMHGAEIRSVMSELKDRIVDIAITKSQNGELKQKNY